MGNRIFSRGSRILHREELEKKFLDHGFSDFKWIDPKVFVVSMWVRMKCVFGCGEYNKNACCPLRIYASLFRILSVHWYHIQGAALKINRRFEVLLILESGHRVIDPLDLGIN